MKSIFKNIMIIRVYELAKSGMSEAAMSKVLGISLPTFRLWETNKKIFAIAVKEGRKIFKGQGKHSLTLQDHIFKRLPPDVKKVWKKINRLQDEKKGFKKIEALLESQGKYVRQHLWLHSYTCSNFNTAAACRKVNIPRVTVDLWAKTDKGFAQIVKELDLYKKDFFENHLIRLIDGGSESATLFANRTYNQDRYPDPKKLVDLNLSGSLNINTICLADLNLPLKTKKALLQSIRIYRKELQNHEEENQS